MFVQMNSLLFDRFPVQMESPNETILISFQTKVFYNGTNLSLLEFAINTVIEIVSSCLHDKILEALLTWH